MSDAVSEAELLKEAVRLAANSATAGQQPFGALIARDGEVLATGVNTVLRDSDPTAHAEVTAIRAACHGLGRTELTGAIVVSSCEPCPMCRAVAVLVGISRIVYAAPKESAARAGFELSPAGDALQEAWSSLGVLPVEHVPTAGADGPFARHLPRSIDPASG